MPVGSSKFSDVLTSFPSTDLASPAEAESGTECCAVPDRPPEAGLERGERGERVLQGPQPGSMELAGGAACGVNTTGAQGPTGPQGAQGVAGDETKAEATAKVEGPVRHAFDWDKMRPVSQLNLDNARGMAILSQYVYEEFGDREGTVRSPIFAELESKGFTLTHFYGKPHTREDSEGKIIAYGKSTQGILAVRGDQAMLIFRGTEPDEPTDRDRIFNYSKTDVEDLGAVHEGFNAALDEVWPEVTEALGKLPEGTKLHLGGHSLGAALATLSAARLAQAKADGKPIIDVLSIYGYGSPRVGDDVFGRNYVRLGMDQLTYRFETNKDKVTGLPPELLGYQHVGTQLHVGDGKHAIRQYCETVLGDCRPVAGQTTWANHAQCVHACVPRRQSTDEQVAEAVALVAGLDDEEQRLVTSNLDPGIAEVILDKSKDMPDTLRTHMQSKVTIDPLVRAATPNLFGGVSSRRIMEAVTNLTQVPAAQRAAAVRIMRPAERSRVRATLIEERPWENGSVDTATLLLFGVRPPPKP